jgi:hypothetical protein
MKDSKIWERLNTKQQTLQNQACVQITLQPPTPTTTPPPSLPTITITDINIGGVDCAGGSCAGGLICSNDGCTPSDTVPVVVTFANSGSGDGTVTPTCSVNGTDSGVAPTEGATITVPAGGTATATFATVTLPGGTNNVCINY